MRSANCRRPNSRTVTRILSLHCGRPLRHRANPFRAGFQPRSHHSSIALRLTAVIPNWTTRPPSGTIGLALRRWRRQAEERRLRAADCVPGRRRSTGDLRWPRNSRGVPEALPRGQNQAPRPETRRGAMNDPWSGIRFLVLSIRRRVDSPPRTCLSFGWQQARKRPFVPRQGRASLRIQLR